MTSLSLQLFIPVNNSFPLCFRLCFSFKCYISRWGVFNIGATSLMSTFLRSWKKRLLMFPPGSEDNQNMLLHLFLIWRILFLILAKICFWFQTDQGEVEFGGCCDAQLVIPDKDQKALQSWYMQIWMETHFSIYICIYICINLLSVFVSVFVSV